MVRAVAQVAHTGMITAIMMLVGIVGLSAGAEESVERGVGTVDDHAGSVGVRLPEKGVEAKFGDTDKSAGLVLVVLAIV